MGSYLYVIGKQTDCKTVKLGISSDPDRRLKQLQTGHPDTLIIHHAEPVETAYAKILEKLLHRDINHLRERGEWFNLSIEDAISHVRFTVIQYAGEDDLERKVRMRLI